MTIWAATTKILLVVTIILFAFSNAVNEMYPAEPGAINILQDKPLPHYTGDTFRHLAPAARIFAGETGNQTIMLDTAWAKLQVMVFRPAYPFIASLLYRATGNLETSFFILSFLFFMLLAVASFKTARLLGLNEDYSSLLSVLMVSNPVTLVYSTLFMIDVPLMAVSVAGLWFFLKIFHEKKTGMVLLASTAATTVLMLLTKLHSIVYMAVPVILFFNGGRKRKIEFAFSIVIPAAIYALWIGINGFDMTGITGLYTYISNNFGCPTCDLGIFSRVFALLSVVYGAILFFPLGVAGEKNKERLWVLGSIIVGTIAVASSGYVGTNKRYYLPLLFPVAVYGMLGLQKLLGKLPADREKRALLLMAAVYVISSVLVITAKYRGFTGRAYL